MKMAKESQISVTKLQHVMDLKLSPSNVKCVCDNDFDTTPQCKINLTFQSQKPPNLKVVLEW